MTRGYLNCFISLLITLFTTFVLFGCASPSSENPDAERLTRSADQMRASGNDVGAADLYQSAILIDPKDSAAHKALAEILETHGDNRNAEMQYTAALSTTPDDMDALRNHARILVKLGRPGDARDEYEKILQTHPNDVKTLNGLGIALDYLDQHSAAQQAYQTALANDPHDLATVNNLGHSYVLTGAYQQAITLMEPHATDKAATPALRQNLAEAYALQGMDADAERMALMDLSMEKAKRNLAYYKSERLKLGLVPKFYADLGGFSTQAMAEGRSQQIKTDFPTDVAGLILAVNPGVTMMGGTPHFDLRATGFHKLDKLKAFCTELKKDGMECEIVTNGT